MDALRLKVQEINFVLAGREKANRFRENRVDMGGVIGYADDAQNRQLMTILRFDLGSSHMKLALHLRQQRLDDLPLVFQ